MTAAPQAPRAISEPPTRLRRADPIRESAEAIEGKAFGMQADVRRGNGWFSEWLAADRRRDERVVVALACVRNRDHLTAERMLVEAIALDRPCDRLVHAMAGLYDLFAAFGRAIAGRVEQICPGRQRGERGGAGR